MKKIIFVCFGNICRSPMAEFVMKDLVAKAGLSNEIFIKSAGCHVCPGTPMALGTREQLHQHEISFTQKKAAQLVEADYATYDYIVGMDRENVADICDIFGGDPQGKVYLLLDFAGEHRDVDDPYCTDDYATAYTDISKGCKAMLEKIKGELK